VVHKDIKINPEDVLNYIFKRPKKFQIGFSFVKLFKLPKYHNRYLNFILYIIAIKYIILY